MGGNVCFDGVRPDRITIRSQQGRDLILDQISWLYHLINAKFFSLHSEYLWSKKRCIEDFLAGSTVHLFDLKIPTNVLMKVKGSFGDIDIQFDKAKVGRVVEMLADTKTIGPFRLVGWLRSVDTVVTLWFDEVTGMRYQVDLELVDFEDDVPSEWSRFSRSSDWDDMVVGIKGFAHKYIFRAITAKDLRTTNIKLKTKILLDKKISPMVFSPKGARVKWRSVDVNLWEEIPMNESTLITDLRELFEVFFEAEPYDDEELEWIKSYSGVIGLIRQYIDEKDHKMIVDGMAHLLWGEGAQVIYRDDPEEDRKTKFKAFDYLTSHLNMDPTNDHHALIDEYYRRLT